jgi:hypothetical protein
LHQQGSSTSTKPAVKYSVVRGLAKCHGTLNKTDLLLPSRNKKSFRREKY